MRTLMNIWFPHNAVNFLTICKRLTSQEGLCCTELVIYSELHYLNYHYNEMFCVYVR